MSENIHVNTGIGKIENNYGTVNVNSKNDEDGFKVRLNFESVRYEIYALFELGKVFRDYDKDWIYLKNKEDFSKIYNLEFNIRDIFEKNYAYGKSCAYEVSMTLLSINSDFSNYPSLTSIINELKKDLINAEKINELQNTLNKSKNMVESQNVNLYSINAMNILLEKQIQSLNEVLRVVRMLEFSDLYKKENPIKNAEFDISDAPEEVKKAFWLFGFMKKHLIKGIIILILFLGYQSKDYIYEQNKHYIHVYILHTEIAQEEKVKLKHIFMTGENFVNLFHEMRDYKSVEISGYKDSLQEHFSALGFNGNELMEDANISQFYWMKKYNKVRSSFEGHIDKNFANYRSLYDAGLNLSVYINSGDKIDLEDFVQDWKKFQENSDFVTPDFDLSKIKSPNDATKIYLEIQKWLNK